MSKKKSWYYDTGTRKAIKLNELEAFQHAMLAGNGMLIPLNSPDGVRAVEALYGPFEHKQNILQVLEWEDYE